MPILGIGFAESNRSCHSLSTLVALGIGEEGTGQYLKKQMDITDQSSPDT